MAATQESMKRFLNYCRQHITGIERSDGRLFLNQFFQAFGYEGFQEAGARYYEVINDGSRNGKTGFADLFWPRSHPFSSVLIQIKSSSEKKLDRYYSLAWDDARNLNPYPHYVILCNFDELWIYDFAKIVYTPIAKIKLVELPEKLHLFSFMELTTNQPIFAESELITISRKIAKIIADLFHKLQQRSKSDNLNITDMQRFIINCVFAMFAQDYGMFPDQQKLSALMRYNLICRDAPWRVSTVPHYNENGCIPSLFFPNKDDNFFDNFQQLKPDELELLKTAASEDWSKIHPAIFGSILEKTMTANSRHAGGVHFTAENDIMKIIRPTISRYWEDKIAGANTYQELKILQQEITDYKVLDPACGSGNFLYIAYQELKQIEQLLLDKITAITGNDVRLAKMPVVTPIQFYGIDNNPLAVEIARLTLIMAQKIAITRLELEEKYLPLDSLNNQIICQDALLINWPEVDAIIGNPPFQSKNKMQQAFGAIYLNQIREKYPEIPGRADYCVYWFRKTHQQLKDNGRAGLVGTNTIKQNYSRQGGLDYIISNGGTIIEAISNQVWLGDAGVQVSIVNWIKGKYLGKKRLYTQLGEHKNSGWQMVEIDYINSALSAEFDVTKAQKILINSRSKSCYQGQTHGHQGFLLTPEEARIMLEGYQKNYEVIFPYLTGNNLLSNYPITPERYVIDFQGKTLEESRNYHEPFTRIKELVLPTREAVAKAEKIRNLEVKKKSQNARVNQHHHNFLAKWWLLSYSRPELINKIVTIPRYIVCSRVTKKPIFEFVNAEIRPGDALQVFPLADNYSFGILQSSFHCLWFAERCSTLAGGFRYTSETVFDTFPWPQNPGLSDVENVAMAAITLRKVRREIMAKYNYGLRELYQGLDVADYTLLDEVHRNLDRAVSLAYGRENEDILSFLFQLNLLVVNQENNRENVRGAGVPDFAQNLEVLMVD